MTSPAKSAPSAAPPAKTGAPAASPAKSASAGSAGILRWRLPPGAALVLAIAGPLLLIVLLAWSPGSNFTEDLGRHLLLGRIISETHSVPRTNLLTYTYPDYPFVNHHWLSEVIFYHLHRVLRLNGLILLKMLVTAGTLALALLTVWPRRRHWIYWIAGLLAAIVLGNRASIRPELFTALGVAFYLWAFERIRRGERWPRWAIPAYALFWSNAHIYFMFGLFMVAAFAAERAFWKGTAGAEAAGRRPFRREAVWLGIVVLASLINPNGISGFLYPLRIFSNYGYDPVENMAPLAYLRTVVSPMLLAFPVLSAITIVAFVGGWRARSWRPADSAIALVSLIMSWAMARSTPLLALSCLPVIGAWLEAPEAVRAPKPRGKDREHERVRGPAASWVYNPGLLVVAAIINLWLVGAVWSGSYCRTFASPVGPSPFGFDDEAQYSRLRELRDAGLKGPVFSNFNIGSLIEYNFYPERAYVDTRPEAFPAAFWKDEYKPCFALGREWDETCRRRGFNAVIVSFTGVGEGFTRALMKRPEWVLVHADGVLGVWVRDLPENRALIDACRMDAPAFETMEQAIAARIGRLSREPAWRRQRHAQEAVYDIYALYCVGENERLWPLLWRLHALYPDYQNVYELMIRVTPPRERVPEVKAYMERQARWPVAVRQVLYWGQQLEAEGRFQEARRAYQRGRLFFPFSRELPQAIARLRGRI